MLMGCIGLSQKDLGPSQERLSTHAEQLHLFLCFILEACLPVTTAASSTCLGMA